MSYTPKNEFEMKMETSLWRKENKVFLEYSMKTSFTFES